MICTTPWNTNLRKVRLVEITQCFLSTHNATNLKEDKEQILVNMQTHES